MIPLEENEHILFTARKHWFVLFGQVLFIVVLGALPALVIFSPAILPANIAGFATAPLAYVASHIPAALFLWTLELLVLWSVFVLVWTDYYLDVWFVTDLRVVGIDQRGLFNRHVATFRLDMIQDVIAEVNGILPTIIDYGTVQVQTASEETFCFRGAAHPNRLKEKILAEHHRAQGEKQEVTIKPSAQV